MTTGHGTYAGYLAHQRRGEYSCDACLDATAEYHARYRFRTGQQHDPRRCRGCGSVFPDHTCQTPNQRINNEGTHA